MTATVMSMANFKGGVGKTSTTALTGWALAKKGKKVLVIDFDPQANLTGLMLKTKASDDKVITLQSSLMAAIQNQEPLESVVINVAPHLDLIPVAIDFSQYPRFLEKTFANEADRISHFRKLLAPLKEVYDYIFIDVGPTMSLMNDSAFFADDEIIIVLQTQQQSLDGAVAFIDYIQNTLIDDFGSSVNALGVLPVLSTRRASVDQFILDEANRMWGEDVFESKVMVMERIKRYGVTGITDDPHDGWDKKVHRVFDGIADEIMTRIEGAE